MTTQGEENRTAFSYRRISNLGRQAKGGGLERQGDSWAAELCEARGWILDGSYDLVDEGRSAFHKQNLKPTAALARFLDLVEGKRIVPGSVLIVESLDRLSRADIDDAYDLFRRIIKAGITIVTREPFREYSSENSGNMLALLEPLFIFARANEESATKSFRTTKAWEQGREKAVNGGTLQCRAQWWLRKTPEGYETVPEMVALALSIFVMAREGLGFKAIKRALDRQGTTAPTPSGHWSVAYLSYLLHSRTVLGEYQPQNRRGGSRVCSGRPLSIYPPIMSEDEWQDTQAAIAGRKGKRGRPSKTRTNLFVGMVRDEESGLPLHLVSKHRGGKGKVYPYLLTRESSWGVNYTAFEACILDTLAMLRPEDVLDRSDRVDEREAEIDAVRKRSASLLQRREQLSLAVADPEQDAAVILPILASVVKAHGEAECRLEALKRERRSGRTEALEEAQTLRQVREKATGEEREKIDRRIRASLPSVVKEITVKVTVTGWRQQTIDVTIHLQTGTPRKVRLLSGQRK